MFFALMLNCFFGFFLIKRTKNQLHETDMPYIEDCDALRSVIIEVLLVLDLLGIEIDSKLTISNLISYSDKFNFIKKYRRITKYL